MTLTEQWKKGELEGGFYYVYLKHLEMFDIAGSSTLSGILERGNENSIEVLAPVPSYEEWKQLHKFLEEFNALDVAKENEQLKELLRKCRSDLMSCFTIGYEDSEFIKKIDEVLK